MSRTLDATQTALVVRGELIPLDLVRLTTYSDKPALTVSETFYFAQRSTLYDFGNGGTAREFWPLLRSVGPVEFSMNHLPSPDDGAILTRRCQIRLDNVVEVQALTLAEHLEGENIPNAVIDWHQLLLSPGQFDVPRIDLSAMTGAEATPFFRGLVRSARIGDDGEIELECETEVPSYVWGVATENANNEGITDHRDKGTRWPIVIGEQKLQRGVNHRVGWRTTLRNALPEGETGNFEVSSTEGFTQPGGSHFAIIGNERVTFAVVDEKTINITGRGQTGGAATSNHAAGDQVTEEPGQVEIVFGLGECDAVTQVYAKNAQGNLVAFDFGTIAVAETTQISGLTVCMLKLSRTEIRDLAALLQQSIDSAPDEASSSYHTYSPTSDATLTSSGIHVTVPGSNRASNLRLEGTGSSGDTDFIQYSYATSDGTHGGKKVLRWRYVVESATAKFSPHSDFFGRPVGSGQLYVRVVSNHTGGEPVKNLGAQDDLLALFPLHNTEETKTNLVSNWQPPTSATLPTLNTILGENVKVDWWFTDGPVPTLSVGDYCYLASSKVYLEFELEETQASASDLQISTGWDLEVYADMTGVVVPSGASSAYEGGSPGSAITRPCDAMRYIIEELLGETIDQTTYEECNTNLGAISVACDLRGLGATLLDALGRLAFESRTNLVPEMTASGTRWKMLTASSTYTYASPSLPAITSWRSGGYVERTLTPEVELANYFQAFYNFNPFVGNDETAFSGLLLANPTTSDVTGVTAATLETREDKFGPIVAEPYFFVALKDETAADTVFGFYVNERSRGPRLVEIEGVPWWLAYSLEPGDIRNVTPPWAGSARKIRILGVTKDPQTELSRIAAIEVT